MATLRAVPDPVSTSTEEPLWRDVLGEHLRSLRQERGETLQETATRAGISMQYLSEIERGTKDPSSEMISAVAGALGSGLGEVTEAVSRRLRTPSRTQATGQVLALAA
ncbi:transcriptional regulator with XRE-family HTH domain [Marmoricola sp. OAE513]|uniref:helix-turn-helix domain-containing protein n=1 Tax=Marmoricola sp. OAE513 TaxID=2817894 RepID=UPI001AE26B57